MAMSGLCVWNVLLVVMESRVDIPLREDIEEEEAMKVKTQEACNEENGQCPRDRPRSWLLKLMGSGEMSIRQLAAASPLSYEYSCVHSYSFIQVIHPFLLVPYASVAIAIAITLSTVGQFFLSPFHCLQQRTLWLGASMGIN